MDKFFNNFYEEDMEEAFYFLSPGEFVSEFNDSDYRALEKKLKENPSEILIAEFKNYRDNRLINRLRKYMYPDPNVPILRVVEYFDPNGNVIKMETDEELFKKYKQLSPNLLDYTWETLKESKTK